MPPNELSPASIEKGMLFCERYRIEGHLDDGGMAAIYLAVDETSGLPVAIKVLFSHYSDNKVVRARFLDEGRIQAMLNHPNIVHVYRVIVEPVLSFVMEYVDGETLEQYLQRDGPLSEVEIVDLILPVMSAVGFAHNKGIIHRDIKPSNVLLKRSSGYLEPKVMDFGVAKVDRERQLTAAGTTVGTLHYMSPEQIVGASSIDGRADIYSLGCTLYKLCTGEVPFNASSEFALMMAQVEAPPEPPRKLRPHLSKGMEEIILRALSKEPEGRFQTIKEMTSALIKLSSPDALRDTDTRPIPASLLEFAMAADEVALDQTAQFRLETLEADAYDRDTVDYDAVGQTHELSTSAIRKIESDRLTALNRHSKTTKPLDAHDKPPPGPGDATDVRNLDQLTTAPRVPSDDTNLRATTDLRATTEQKRPNVGDDQKSTTPDQTRRFTRKSDGNIVAVDRAGVDSKDITNKRIAIEKYEAAVEESTNVVPRKPASPVEVAPEAEEYHESITSQQRPSALMASTHVEVKPEAGDEEDLESATAIQRPSALLSGNSPALSSPKRDSAPEIKPPELVDRSLEAPLAQRIPDLSRRTTAHDDNSDDPQPRGLIWLFIGIIAVLLALLVLVWALFFSS